MNESSFLQHEIVTIATTESKQIEAPIARIVPYAKSVPGDNKG